MKKYKIFWSLFLYFFGSLFLQTILDKLVNPDNILIYSIGLIINYLILVFCFYLIYRIEINKMFKDFKKNYRQYLKTGLLIWLVGFIIMIFLNYLINFVINDGTIAANETLVRELMTKYLFYSLIVNGLLAPIIEEIIFRLGFNFIKNKYYYLTVTSLIFGFLHILSDISNPLYILPYLALGLTFGLAYYKTNNIFTSITIHAWHNILTCVVILIF